MVLLDGGAVAFAQEHDAGAWFTPQLRGGRLSRIIALSPIEVGELLICRHAAERFRPLLSWRGAFAWERRGSGYVLRTSIDVPAGSVLALRDLRTTKELPP